MTAPNGNRVGIAATAVEKDGTVTAIRDVQSLNIRIAREERGCARGVLNTLFVAGCPVSLWQRRRGAVRPLFCEIWQERCPAGSVGDTGR